MNDYKIKIKFNGASTSFDSFFADLPNIPTASNCLSLALPMGHRAFPP